MNRITSYNVCYTKLLRPEPLARCAHIPILAGDPATRPDLAPLDLGSINIDPYVPGRGFAVEDLVYRNPVGGIRGQIRAIHAAGVPVEAVLWSVGANSKSNSTSV